MQALFSSCVKILVLVFLWFGIMYIHLILYLSFGGFESAFEGVLVWLSKF